MARSLAVAAGPTNRPCDKAGGLHNGDESLTLGVVS